MQMNASKFGRFGQTGSVGGWIVILLFVGAAMSMISKLAPLYMDHNTMAKVLDTVAAEEGHSNKSDNQIREMLLKRFKINNIRDFDLKDNLQVERSSKGAALVMDYEVRMPLVGNIDIIASFDKRVDLRD